MWQTAKLSVGVELELVAAAIDNEVVTEVVHMAHGRAIVSSRCMGACGAVFGFQMSNTKRSGDCIAQVSGELVGPYQLSRLREIHDTDACITLDTTAHAGLPWAERISVCSTRGMF